MREELRWSRYRITEVRDHPPYSPRDRGSWGVRFSLLGMLFPLRRFHPRKGTNPEAPLR
jgi:hypothetical protein